jgi:hypothetical protein
MAMGPVLYVVARRRVPVKQWSAQNKVRPQLPPHLSAVETKV